MLSTSQLLRFIITLILATKASSWEIPTEYSIKASPDGRDFITSKGEPFFWQADTAWVLFHRLTLPEVETYLDDRAAKGFNMLLAVAVVQFGDQDPNRAGDLPFLNRDPTKPNEVYFEHVDKVVQMAWDRGLRIAMVPAWGNYIHDSNNVPKSINVSNAKVFGTWVGKRYPGLPKMLVADTNSYWTNKTAVSNNYKLGGFHEPLEYTDYSAVYDGLASGLIEGEGSEAMITIHCTNQWFEGGPIALASAFFGDRKWLTFDTSQSGHASYPPNPPIPWWNAVRGYEPVELMYTSTKTRPVLDNEPKYENRFDNGKPINPYWNASDIRIGTYQSVFSGAAGLTYGADNVMQFYNPEFFEPSHSGPAISWVEDIHLAGSSQIQYIKKVIMDRSFPFNRIPDQSIIVGDSGTDSKHLAAIRDSNGQWLMVYTPVGTPFVIDTNSLKLDNVKASWYDTLSGIYQVFEWEMQRGRNIFSPPLNGTHEDWVLVLERKIYSAKL